MTIRLKRYNAILPIVLSMAIACHTPKEQVAATTPKVQPAMKPALAVNTKDSATKKKPAHALHRDEPIQQAAAPRREPSIVPAKRSEPAIVKPNYKQDKTYTPSTLKNAPKPGN